MVERMNEQNEKKVNNQLLPPMGPYNGDEPYIFVAYAIDDKYRVYPEIINIYNQGYRIWYAESIASLNNWQETIENAITKSSYIMIFLSPAAILDPHLQYEISYSIYRKKKILLIFFEKTKIPSNLSSLIDNNQDILKYGFQKNLDEVEKKINTHSTIIKRCNQALDSKIASKCLSKGYRILEKLNESTQTVVFKAEDIKVNRLVALKIFMYSWKRDINIIKRFNSEARLTAFFSFPNTISTYDIGELDNDFYISMEFFQGKDLSKFLVKQESLLTVSQILFIASEVLKAFSYFHRKGIYHGNIKPSNILYTIQKEIKIMGFGHGAVFNTKRGFFGTPFYMSPEQIQSLKIDHRTDIYSFGATLFHLLTGKVPFKGENIFYEHLFEPTPSIKKYRTDIPDRLIEIVEKCMVKKREDRYQNALEIIEEIEALKRKIYRS